MFSAARKIFLSGQKGKDKFALVDTLRFDFLSRFTWWSDKDGYAYTMLPPCGGYGITTLKMHQLVVGRPLGANQIDHINRNKLDNRAKNLRIVSQSKNQLNIPLRPNNKTGHAGVKKVGNVWPTYGGAGGRAYIGCFKTKEAAILARKIWEKKQ